MRFAYFNKDDQNTNKLYNRLAEARKAQKLAGEDYIVVRAIDSCYRTFCGYAVVYKYNWVTEEV